MQLTAADKLRTSNDQYSKRNYSQNVPVTVTNEKPFVQSELDGWHLHVHVVFVQCSWYSSQTDITGSKLSNNRERTQKLPT